MAAQLQKGKEDNQETKTKKCWVGCGRDAADGYESCCRTCSWYPQTPGWRHGPTCNANHYAKADIMSNGEGPSEGERDDPDKEISQGIPQTVPKASGPVSFESSCQSCTWSPKPVPPTTGTTSKAAPPSLPNARGIDATPDKTIVSLPIWNCTRANWTMRAPTIAAPVQLLPRSYPSHIMTVGKYRGKPYEWVIRNDAQYCHWIMKMEERDELSDSLTIFAHFCFENPELAGQHDTKQITKSTGPCEMITTTFTGYGRAMLTGSSTVSMFAMTAQDISDSPRRFKGFTIDPMKLKTAIRMVAEGKLSLDDLSWIWNEGNYIVTAQEEIFYFMHS